ncbi:hypothetical protein F5B18DRAFT_645286 [Nemania serpens]|nr:hypothetical protein F5B18DRAFT_645286 [Nemania serpens]
MPSEENEARSHRRLEPLNFQTIAPFKISAFAATFLLATSRPDFPFVAPEVRVSMPFLLNEIYGAEASDSVRRTHWLGDEEDWPTLILPGMDRAPHDIGQRINQNINSFDQNWRFGKFTVDRQSGLYTMPDTGSSDLVRFVASSGLCNACESRSPCRWEPPREPGLAGVFDHWTALVENGTWTVDVNGVSTDHAYFIAHTSMMMDRRPNSSLPLNLATEWLVGRSFEQEGRHSMFSSYNNLTRRSRLGSVPRYPSRRHRHLHGKVNSRRWSSRTPKSLP